MHYKASLRLLVTNLVILTHGQVTRTTPELAPPFLTSSPYKRSPLNGGGVLNSPRLDLMTRRVVDKVLQCGTEGTQIESSSLQQTNYQAFGCTLLQKSSMATVAEWSHGLELVAS
ncbi:hypothetical protein TNCV_1866571 [Trichonephila clavipes]|nr:hypothetical protein TNCV_1866571 [Trichonephila clavipes]